MGITLAFASLGGVLVTMVSAWINKHGADFPHIGLPAGLGSDVPSTWRYLLMTGILPAIPIALLLPFVPESKVWKDKKASGALKRPSFARCSLPSCAV
jgi:MFS family permease